MNKYTSHSDHASFDILYMSNLAFLSRIKQKILKFIKKPSKIIKLAILIIIIVILSYISISVLSGKVILTSISNHTYIKPLNNLNVGANLKNNEKIVSKASACSMSNAVQVQSVSFNKTSITLNEGETAVLMPTINPSNANEPVITLFSSDTHVATVNDKGIVKAMGKGIAFIETTSINCKAASCKLTVNPKKPLIKNTKINSSESYPIYTNSGTIIYSQFGDKEGTLSIPNVNISNMPIFHGDGEEQLSYGIGQFIGGHYPGENGKVILAGHNYSSFKNLENIKNGDKIYIELAYGKFIYQVYETEIVNENNSNILQPDDSHEYLIMYTCYPFNAGSYHPERFVVYAKLI